MFSRADDHGMGFAEAVNVVAVAALAPEDRHRDCRTTWVCLYRGMCIP
jgi:hypothetical protein